jgi:hypothetical protein
MSEKKDLQKDEEGDAGPVPRPAPQASSTHSKSRSLSSFLSNGTNTLLSHR